MRHQPRPLKAQAPAKPGLPRPKPGLPRPQSGHTSHGLSQASSGLSLASSGLSLASSGFSPDSRFLHPASRDLSPVPGGLSHPLATESEKKSIKAFFVYEGFHEFLDKEKSRYFQIHWCIAHTSNLRGLMLISVACSEKPNVTTDDHLKKKHTKNGKKIDGDGRWM